MSTAIAIFVKTPNLSPLKTRLAAGIGEDKALEFYHLSLQCLIETIKNTGLKAYWAVGEKEALISPLWQDFETLHTGGEDLGDRQFHVYQTLLEKHDNVILIGADAPQISSDTFNQTIHFLENNNFVFGPANDGGYYLLGGNKEIEKEIWQQVPWSNSNTLKKFEEQLLSKAAHLQTLTDIDKKDDLKSLLKETPKTPTKSQRELIDWINATL